MKILIALLLSLSAAGPAFAASEPAKTLTLQDLPSQVLRGEKPGASKTAKLLILDFWASWCEPCRQSLPFYDDLQKRYAKKGVQFVGISADENETEAKEFLSQVKFSFPALWDKDRALVKKLGLQAIPVLVVMTTDGRVLATESGFTNKKRQALPGKIDGWLKDL